LRIADPLNYEGVVEFCTSKQQAPSTACGYARVICGFPIQARQSDLFSHSLGCETPFGYRPVSAAGWLRG
jgi:hypothetical protein